MGSEITSKIDQLGFGVEKSPSTPKLSKIAGLISAPVTPFKENGDVNYEMVAPYVDHLVEFGISNVFLTGTLGEGMHLTVSERKKLIEEWMKHGRSKLETMIVHIGTANIRDSQELARHAQEIGADAFACVGPSYFKPPTLEDYVSYMAEVASAAPKLPFLLYDIDFITGIKFNTAKFFNLAKDRIPNLVGCKHTSPVFPYMHSILRDHGDRYQVLLGSDETFLEALSIGIESTIMSSFLGNILNRVKKSFDEGDLATARKEQGRAILVSELREKNGLIGPNASKVPLKILGLDMGHPRLPLSPHTQTQIDAFKKDLESAGFFEWGMSK